MGEFQPLPTTEDIGKPHSLEDPAFEEERPQCNHTRRNLYLGLGLGGLLSLILIGTMQFVHFQKNPYLNAPAAIVAPNTSTALRSTEGRYDGYVVGVKTGFEVIADHIPMALETHLRGVQNIVLFGDKAMQLGEFHMVDVIKDLYNVTEAKLREQHRWDQANAPRVTKKKSKRSLGQGTGICLSIYYFPGSFLVGRHILKSAL
jgi:hypothetical protein